MGSAVPSRVSLLILHTQAGSGAFYLYEIPHDFRGGVDLFQPPYAIGSVRGYRVTQLRTDSVHCRESAGTGPVVLKIVPVSCTVLPLHHHVCVCVFSSHSFWTSSSLDVPAGVTQEEGHTGFLIHLSSAVRALIFLARRIQPFLFLVDREVEFCVLTI